MTNEDWSQSGNELQYQKANPSLARDISIEKWLFLLWKGKLILETIWFWFNTWLSYTFVIGWIIISTVYKFIKVEWLYHFLAEKADELVKGLSHKELEVTSVVVYRGKGAVCCSLPDEFHLDNLVVLLLEVHTTAHYTCKCMWDDFRLPANCSPFFELLLAPEKELAEFVDCWSRSEYSLLVLRLVVLAIFLNGK